jgi:DNA mismatch repair protein MutS
MLNNITVILFNKIKKVSTYVNICKNIVESIKNIIGNNKIYADIEPSEEVIKILKSNICEKLYDTMYKNKHVFYCQKGKYLKLFLELRETYDTVLKPLLLYIGKIDKYLSIVTLYNELKSSNKHVCFAEYKLSSVPIIHTKKNWFIKLKNNGKIVTNSYKVGNPIRNCVITGPNAGGKSTHIKTVIFSVLLSQTFGIVPARNFVVTPFHKINTYLNIPDNTGKESLFQAEMCRCRDYIDNLESLLPNQFSIIVMDEIFSSTNPEDGIAAGFSILEYLSKKTNNMCLITTHYKYLTGLSGFKNYKFPIRINTDGSFTYLYKLKKGINDQYIAIELLKEYMNREIYNSAINIRKSIL